MSFSISTLLKRTFTMFSVKATRSAFARRSIRLPFVVGGKNEKTPMRFSVKSHGKLRTKVVNSAWCIAVIVLLKLLIINSIRCLRESAGLRLMVGTAEMSAPCSENGFDLYDKSEDDLVRQPASEDVRWKIASFLSAQRTLHRDP
jgi:hypothetical protein